MVAKSGTISADGHPSGPSSPRRNGACVGCARNHPPNSAAVVPGSTPICPASTLGVPGSTPIGPVNYRNPMAFSDGSRPCWCSSTSLGNLSTTETVLTTLSGSEYQLHLPTEMKTGGSLGESSFKIPAPLSPWRKHLWTTRVVDYCIVFPLTCFVVWAMGYILFGASALPGGSLFALAVLELLAITLGHVAEQMRYPPLLGMIIAGLILRNVPYLNVVGLTLDLSITNPLRAMSVVVLLTRGAFGVSPEVIRRFKWVIPQLSIGSCVMEAIAGSIAAYYILGFPVQYAAAVGCIFSAMSGAAVAPYYANLENKGLGLEHHVMTIAKQGSGLDAILAINLTEIFGFGFIFANGDLAGGLTKGVVEVLMGAGFALLWGCLAGIFLDNEHGSPLRTFTVFAGGSMSLLGLTKIGYPRGGPLGCFMGSCITACIWRRKKVDGVNNDKVSENFTGLWFIFQPLLFGIIGSRIDFTTVEWDIVGRGVLCLGISISVRMCTTFSSLCFATGMTVREKLFMVVAWLPKGTVQAALGPVALETALALNSAPEVQQMAYRILCISATTIVLGSAFGASMLLIFGSRLLRH